MKKQYEKPTMTVVRIQHTSIICTSPNAYDEVGGGAQFARRHGGFDWDDDWDEE